MNISSKWYFLAGFLIISILTVDVVLLTLKNRRLEEQLLNSSPLAQGEPLQPGDVVQGFSVKTLDGGELSIDYDEPHSTYLLFVFSTTCPHCLANLDKWKIISERTTDNCYVVAVSIHDVDMTTEYIIDKKLPFYTVSVSDVTFQQNYKINGVPSTILIAEGGRIVNEWVGRLEDDDVEAVLLAEQKSDTLLH